jgi:fructose-1,6-bisphosphatase/inositol monophosphatase family enzyme
MVYVPVTGEIFFAVEGFGAYLNNWDKPIHVSANPLLAGPNSPKDAMLHVEFPNVTLKEGKCEEFSRMCGVVSRLMENADRVRGLGLGSLGLAYVAKGAFEGYVTLAGSSEWTDVAAGVLFVKEAGGQVCMQNCAELVKDGVRVIASNKECFDQLKKDIGVNESWRDV